jgi:hypothetical protein
MPSFNGKPKEVDVNRFTVALNVAGNFRRRLRPFSAALV